VLSKTAARSPIANPLSTPRRIVGLFETVSQLLSRRYTRRQRPSRVGQKGVAFWVVRILAAEEDRTVQSLMEEALDLLFRKRGRYRLAVSLRTLCVKKPNETRRDAEQGRKIWRLAWVRQSGGETIQTLCTGPSSRA
jgi:hypothetical protein